jgi:predicted dithiol-disulfide oxidoreductase (DUF899 family)
VEEWQRSPSKYFAEKNNPKKKEKNMKLAEMETPKVVSSKNWEAARQKLLVKEKELTRARDALAAERRRMPWLAVEKEYEFGGPDGKVSLLDLFDGRRQLIVYRSFIARFLSRAWSAGPNMLASAAP